MFKRILKYLFLLVFTAGLAFLYGFSSERNLKEKVANVEVEFIGENQNFLTHAMVDKLLIQNTESVKKLPKSAINLYKLEQSVTSNPYIETSSVFFGIDGVLKSVVKQRTPIARIINKEDSYYIDKQGVKTPLSKNYSARVLLITGVDDQEDLLEIIDLVTLILEDDFLKKEIIGIEKIDNNQYQFSVRSGDYKIDFGKLSNIDLKFRKLKAFYNKTFVDKTIKNYKKINLKYHNQVVCTK